MSTVILLNSCYFSTGIPAKGTKLKLSKNTDSNETMLTLKEPSGNVATSVSSVVNNSIGSGSNSAAGSMAASNTCPVSNSVNSRATDATTAPTDSRWRVTVIASKPNESEPQNPAHRVEYEVPTALTVAQVLAGLKMFSGIQDTYIKIRIQNKSGSDNQVAFPKLPECPGVSLLLEEFSNQGGLSILAQHMTILYPDMSRQSPAPPSGNLNKSGSAANTPLTNSIINAANLTSGSGLLSMQQNTAAALNNVAPHTLGAFTLFLRLPGYAESLLQEPAQAKALLRMALGVQENGKDSLRPDSIATVVYTHLNKVLKNHPVNSVEGKNSSSTVRRVSVLLIRLIYV